MMQVKRYMAASYAEALILAKNELGTDAVIVESRKVKVGGFFGLFGREMTELTVAVDQPPEVRRAPRPAPAAQPQAAPAAVQAPPAAVQAPPAAVQPAPAPAANPPEAQPSLATIEREMAGLKQALHRLAESRTDPSAIRELKGYGLEVYERLLDAGVDEAAALSIARKVGTERSDGECILAQELALIMGPGAPIQAAPGQRRVVALVGPTGVGKTTTLAKLAAHFALDRHLKVGLITSDTFRIAAVEQLRTYADILGLPVYTVERAEEVTRALEATAGADLVLIDTGGRSHKDEERMAELRELLAIARPDEIHLVVSLNMNPRDIDRMLEHYLPIGVNRFIFTKVDETSAPGVMLNIRLKWDRPVGYLTNGQSVPDDLVPSDAANYIRLIMGA